MAGQSVDEQGNVYEEGWDGQYRQKQGWLGPERETDWLGNAKVDRDWLGNPKQETDWLGNQRTSSEGRGLFQLGGGGGRGSNDIGGAIGGFIATVILTVAFLALFALIKLLISICRNHPRVGYPLVGALIGVPLLLMVLSNVTPRTGMSPGVMAASPPRAAPAALPVIAAVTAAPTMPPPTAKPTTVPTATVEPPRYWTSGSTAPAIVGNTEGKGVYLRRVSSTEQADRLQSWQDGTLLQPTGKLASFKGVQYSEARDPRDTLGWIPSEYARPAPDGSATRSYVVGNTDGQGVSLRRSAGSNERHYAVPDGTILTATGKSEERDGQRWLEVRDPKGTVGWVPARYLMAR